MIRSQDLKDHTSWIKLIMSRPISTELMACRGSGTGTPLTQQQQSPRILIRIQRRSLDGQMHRIINIDGLCHQIIYMTKISRGEKFSYFLQNCFLFTLAASSNLPNRSFRVSTNIYNKIYMINTKYINNANICMYIQRWIDRYRDKLIY